MENPFLYILTGLSALTVALCAIILYRLKNVTYLLEQPVVKKMSPQLRLKPVKVEESDADIPPRRGNRPERAFSGRGGRGHQERGEGPDRGGREPGQRDRHPRHEREKGEGGEGPGRERHRDRGPRRDRGRSRPHEVFSNEKEPEVQAPRGEQPALSARGERPILDANNNNSAQPVSALAPRRPLPSAADKENGTGAAEKPVSSGNNQEEQGFFGAEDSEIQHGRRNQMKRRPRFDLEEEEIDSPTQETKSR